MTTPNLQIQLNPNDLINEVTRLAGEQISSYIGQVAMLRAENAALLKMYQEATVAQASPEVTDGLAAIDPADAPDLPRK